MHALLRHFSKHLHYRLVVGNSVNTTFEALCLYLDLEL